MIYAFDIDGVLTDTGYNIDPNFKDWFVDWAHDKHYVLVTGSTYERTLEQIGPEITGGAMLVANCMGNSVFQNETTTVLNEFELTEDEIKFFNSKINSSKFKIRAGNHIVQRPGSVNFSVVGRDATTEEREEYKRFDHMEQERLAIAKEIYSKFPRFDVFIGGDISIDICLKGCDKSQLMHYIGNFPEYGNGDISFFGDKMGPYGIDQPLAKLVLNTPGGKVFHVCNGYAETQDILTHW